MLALGIDPGSTITGYAVISGDRVVEAGVFRLRGKHAAEKLVELMRDMAELLARYPALELAGVESPFVGQYLNSVVPLSQARGVILAAIAAAGVEVHDIAPAQVKKLCGAGGRADKGLVRTVVSAKYSLPVSDAPADAFDAVAVAHAVILLASCGGLARRKPAPPRTHAGGRRSTGPHAS